MALKHLSDTEIQDYIDGNLSQKQTAILNDHLCTCKKCQKELDEYQVLFTELKKEPTINLSTHFTKTIISKINQESTETFNISLRDILLSVLGLILAIGTTFAFVDVKTLLKSFNSMFKPQVDSGITIFTKFQQLMAAMNIDINLFLFAGIILLIILLIDHVVYRHRHKLISFMRTQSIFCHL